MLLMVVDYIKYRLRVGPYGDDPNKNLLALGYIGSIPTETLSRMVTGDLLLIQELNSFFAWGAMYFQNTYVSHVAIYIYKNKVFHQTLTYSKKHPLRIFFNNNTRILPIKMIAGEPSINTPDTKLENIRYPDERRLLRKNKLILAFKVAPSIFFNVDNYNFRWEFAFDFILLMIGVNAAAYLYWDITWLTFIFPAYFAFLASMSVFRLVKHRIYKIEPSKRDGIGYIQDLIFSSNALLMSNEKAIGQLRGYQELSSDQTSGEKLRIKPLSLRRR